MELFCKKCIDSLITSLCKLCSVPRLQSVAHYFFHHQGLKKKNMNTVVYTVVYTVVGGALGWMASRRLWKRDAAVATIHTECDTGASGVRGTIRLSRDGAYRTRAVCDLHGLSHGYHGLHVHRCGDFSQGCASTCDHYNPDGAPHGGPRGLHRHRGDFGNVWADRRGRCTTSVVADVTVDEILGRAFVIHAGEDDLGKGQNEESLKTGNAGARIAGGLIVSTTS